MPLYPTETLLWDGKQIPSTHYQGDAPLALPKLNLQFLTFWDYLLRNFNLFRLEATYEIREDVTDTLRVRLQPPRLRTPSPNPLTCMCEAPATHRALLVLFSSCSIKQ